VSAGGPATRALLPLRTLVLLIVALIFASAAGALTWANTGSEAAAALAGAAAFGATLKLLHELVE
jgi:hypothetical protein